jgi:hypothetical protein
MKIFNKNFWPIFISSLYFFCQCVTSTAHAGANEVGNNLTFVAEPKASPIFTSKSGTRYWPCEGMVAPALIEIVQLDLTDISKEENIPPPMTTPCHYKIGSVKLSGETIYLFSVNFYISKESMISCVQKDYCDNVRNMTFMLKDDKLHRQYMLTNVQKKLTRMSCLEMQGKIVSARDGC